MSARGLAFVKLVVADLDRAEGFYHAVFGLAASHSHAADTHAYAQEERMLAAPEGSGSTLILTRYLRQSPPPAGAAWTGFIVPDIAATAEAIVAAGGAVLVPVHSSDTHAVMALVARDPDGHMIEVIELLPAGP